MRWLAGGLLLLLAASPPAFRFEFRSSPKSRISFKDISGGDGQMPLLEQNGQGVCAFDYDGDGFLDLYFVNGSTEEDWSAGKAGRSALFHNNGNGSFSDVTARAGVPGPRWGNGCAPADYDGDGRTDLFVTGWNGSVLYRNRGDGTFEDVTARSSIAVPGWASAAAWADVDGDGRLDLVVSRYADFDWKSYPKTDDDGVHGTPCDYKGVPAGCPPGYHPAETPMLFLQRADGFFRDASNESGLSEKLCRGLGVVALPLFDSSKRPDIAIAVDQAPNVLFANVSSPGSPRFVEVGLERGFAINAEGRFEASMGLAAGDVWEDGRPALFVTNFEDEKNTLSRNSGSDFADVSRESHLDVNRPDLSWGTALADLDNDSHLDILVADGHIYPQVRDLHDPSITYDQPVRLYAGKGRGTFEDTPAPWAVKASRRGLAVADLNNDGRLDLVFQVHRGVPEIFWNVSSPDSHWIAFDLEGARPRDPFAAKITIRLSDGTSRAGWRLPNQGYEGSSDPRVYFGLGAANRIEGLSIVWPDGSAQKLNEKLAAGRLYRIRQGGRPASVKLRGFSPPR